MVSWETNPKVLPSIQDSLKKNKKNCTAVKIGK